MFLRKIDRKGEGRIPKGRLQRIQITAELLQETDVSNGVLEILKKELFTRHDGVEHKQI